MPTSRRFGLGEAVLTTALLSIWLGSRGTARVLGAVQGVYVR